MIDWIENVGAADIARVGGKGANLSEARAAGLPVPEAFVVTTSAYRFTTDSLRKQLIDAARSGDGAAARALVAAALIPVRVEDMVRAAYGILGSGPVAVRSSATAEDL